MKTIDQWKKEAEQLIENMTDEEVIKFVETPDRAYDLLMIARAMRHRDIKINSEQIDQPIVAEQSIFDLLRQDSLNKDLIIFAGSRLDMLSTDRDVIPDPFE